MDEANRNYPNDNVTKKKEWKPKPPLIKLFLYT